MDNNVTEKLNKFSSLVMRDAEKKRDELLGRVEQEYDEKIDEKENEFLEDAYENIQNTVREARRDANEKVLHTELDAKKRLILRREEIIDEIMSEAQKKLAAFTKDAQYETWLTEKTKQALFELGDGKKTVYLSPEDYKFKDKIAALSEDITVEADNESGFTGGVKVTNIDRKTAADYSFATILAEQKQKFLRESGLTLD